MKLTSKHTVLVSPKFLEYLPKYSRIFSKLNQDQGGLAGAELISDDSHVF